MPVGYVALLVRGVVRTVMQVGITVSRLFVQRGAQAGLIQVDIAVEKVDLVVGVFAVEFYTLVGPVDCFKEFEVPRERAVPPTRSCA